MKQKRTLGFLFIIMLLVSSCATTSISYLHNPDIQLSSFKKIMIFAPFQDISWRKKMEGYFVEEFLKHSMNAVSSVEVISPLKAYTDQELNQVLIENEVDAVITISILDAYTDTSYVPQTSTTTGSARVYGNTAYGQSRTTTTGGYYVTKPRVKFEVNLFEATTGVLAWKATAFTAGDGFSNTDTLFKSLAVKVTKEYMLQP